MLEQYTGTCFGGPLDKYTFDYYVSRYYYMDISTDLVVGCYEYDSKNAQWNWQND